METRSMPFQGGGGIPAALAMATITVWAYGIAMGAEEVSGPELATRLRWTGPSEQTVYNGALETRAPTGERKEIPIRLRTITGGDGWTNVYETLARGDKPSERLVVSHHPPQPNRYFIATTPNAQTPFSEAKPVHELMTPFADSDFWLADLGREFYHWPIQEILKEDRRRTRLCYVLESRPHDSEIREAGYSRVLTWVDKKSGAILRAEAYDTDGKKLKIFSVGRVEKVNGEWKPEDIEMRNVQRHSFSQIEFKHRP